MLRARTEVVSKHVDENFPTCSEVEKRRLESMVLQMLAAIYSPPRSVTPIDVDTLLTCVRESKLAIDAFENRNRTAISPIPAHVRLEPEAATMTHPFVCRPVARRAGTVLRPL